MARIVVMQPYVPTYRAPLFAALDRRLRDAGHELVIASGAPLGAQAKRLDSAEVEGVRHRDLSIRLIRLGPIQLRLTRSRPVWRDADVVVAELAAGSLATYAALLQRRRAVAVWGHVDAFVASDTRLTRWLRRWQTRRAAHVLAYTDRGAAVARSWGVPAQRITVLHNTIDTVALRHAVEQNRLTSTQAEIRDEFGLGPGPVFAMIGGIDASKRVDLVVSALEELWGRRPDIQLIVGGRGDLESDFDRARERGQVRLLGHVDDEQKGRIARIAVALVNPGRVGLIAVESMTMALPIITTTTARHGPEFEYLTPGVDAVVCAPEARAIADELVRLVDHPAAASTLQSAIARKAEGAQLSDMVDRFVQAVDLLARGNESRGRRFRRRRSEVPPQEQQEQGI
ncbi:glycosyltransferase family 4 protein [Curtobacterium flaccumfaciens]|uniref:glycosyltransferase family 4 protein n=1 Tax=Curtobacterium flaccumfaciens TaxID=2035 RepID=UPI00188C73CD|nr:glycosyltransferase family 4 protein [Curtobacterium flaccumfaciens]MBF4592226.1 glycosyltransferase family 4 protein [Curtobacterium flaccumfaciens]